MKDWSNTAGNSGSVVFKVGKGIGILGRSLGLLVLLFVVLGSIASSNVLLVAGYMAGFAVFAFLAIELVARAIMLVGNMISSKSQQRGK
jgi:hypothetical protein